MIVQNKATGVEYRDGKGEKKEGGQKGSIWKQYSKHDEVVLLKDLTLKASNSVLSGPPHPLTRKPYGFMQSSFWVIMIVHVMVCGDL